MMGGDAVFILIAGVLLSCSLLYATFIFHRVSLRFLDVYAESHKVVIREDISPEDLMEVGVFYPNADDLHRAIEETEEFVNMANKTPYWWGDDEYEILERGVFNG